MTLEGKAETVIEFLKEVQRLIGDKAEIDRPVLYRGQRDREWGLVPKVARIGFKKDFVKEGSEFWTGRADDDSAERGLYNFFRDWAASAMPAWAMQGDDEKCPGAHLC